MLVFYTEPDSVTISEDEIEMFKILIRYCSLGSSDSHNINELATLNLGQKSERPDWLGTVPVNPFFSR